MGIGASRPGRDRSGQCRPVGFSEFPTLVVSRLANEGRPGGGLNATVDAWLCLPVAAMWPGPTADWQVPLRQFATVSNARVLLSQSSLLSPQPSVLSFGLGSNIGHGLFVGWVEHPDIFVGFRSSTQPTCQPFLGYQRNPTKWPKIGPSP